MRPATARLAGEFIKALTQVSAPMLHFGPGPHGSGSPQSVHAGGANPATRPPKEQMGFDFDSPPEPARKPIVGWHTTRPGGFSIGLPGQRGPGTYVSLDFPWQPGAGQVMTAEIDVAPAEILDPRDLMEGTDVEKSRRDQRAAIDRMNAMSEEELRRRGGTGIESLHKALRSLYLEMGYKAEAGLIEPGMPEKGRELVVWDRKNVKLTPAKEDAR